MGSWRLSSEPSWHGGAESPTRWRARAHGSVASVLIRTFNGWSGAEGGRAGCLTFHRLPSLPPSVAAALAPAQCGLFCEVACSPHSYTHIHINCELLWKQQKHTCWYHGGVQPAGGPSTSASWRLASALLQKLHQGLKEYQRQGELSIEFQNGDVCDRESSNPFRSVRHPPSIAPRPGRQLRGHAATDQSSRVDILNAFRNSLLRSLFWGPASRLCTSERHGSGGRRQWSGRDRGGVRVDALLRVGGAT